MTVLRLARSLAVYARHARHYSAGASTDKILMKGLVFHGYHGVLPEERTLGQKFVVDATLSVSLQKAGLSDNLADTISYASAYDTIRSIVQGPPRELVECVAENVARSLLEKHSAVQAVTVSVTKPHVAVVGIVEKLGIEITRSREDL
ncbi:hypothetical protein H632_c2384p1 [Helicosporidium sp. ATCC 50920]|nr:hypothetical protein H632_c2384p1 [Helicosporidium sp. ATCC 50920]|eukprot:KDD73247.1 hypothetical protein H632_c2384p1 [Helicosporidium sp. ATCC 50920]